LTDGDIPSREEYEKVHGKVTPILMKVRQTALAKGEA
jgi:hypothetical protein